MNSSAKFFPGQVVRHRLFGYRGVIVDVDPVFSGTDQWYQTMARSLPPKDKPWYHVLVDNKDHQTYVAERNLEADSLGEPVSHPMLELFFDGFSKGRYHLRRRVN